MRSVGDETTALASGAQALGVHLDLQRAGLLIRYLDELYLWNTSAGLTTIARDEAVRLHLLDSLSAVPDLERSETIVDLGSGAGLPGIPIAVALPSARVTLLESRRRKSTFLAHAIRELGLRNCRVVQGDARRPSDLAGTFAAAIARAFLPAGELLAVAKAFVKPHGRIVIMGARRQHELDTVGSADALLVRVGDRSFDLPGGHERRRILVFQAAV